MTNLEAVGYVKTVYVESSRDLDMSTPPSDKNVEQREQRDTCYFTARIYCLGSDPTQTPPSV